ncbi:preprotein translocase subunit SecA [Candidatus Aminicenantes bacterium AC-335-K20]|jgi:preprotein translocase subunit SecA|nr:preprotein translocase subunit SecA [SCandidatus Aminicenantes bacterium Aminicenantia_JdfR_composite]MCP2598338.1 preprotein translocase subunit SecA [Candidatus Aminicenantes bacterium AC-335-L06]MCP2605821.1 preprotein translocase subunit SecA [Candidatus Aminicenantes bacterium AC-335-O07]MCP2606060.1 preprotein translocase subunit SecA [Candidatus Aminicenantes bacterium AC-708-I09]MCP2618385.1 preprotein translocase subunit SecA [Candidatus Aminicenantes bacterium AC-335-A11]MCP261938
MIKILQKIFGTKNERELKKLQPIVNKINELEPKISKLTDAQLKAKTSEFKEKLAQGATLDDLLVEAFAVVREVAKRTVYMRHFDVQLMGGIVLHQGKIAEMKTGEGKTLVATLPAYLNALEGKGVHIVTVNDYLARRDTEWMGPIYKFLGLTVGTIQHGMSDIERKKAYQADITYGTNNEFGFDYLRDNMKFRLEDIVQRGHNYAIVDEVDSILIDEARTPLIISGPTEESTALYYRIDNLVRRLKRDVHYQVDEKTRTVVLTEEGVAVAEKFLNIPNLYDLKYMHIVHHINQALKAHTLFKKDRDYIVKDGKVIIVDEFTGRLMPGRRYSDGLHQALEAKERVRIEEEYQTLASITFQNYFRMYKKLAGMTGTAATEANEFKAIYNLDVIVIPTNKPLRRYEYDDVIYRTKKEKWEAVVKEIEECHKIGRPVLVGTTSIENSEHLSSLLRKRGIKHVVLNAKHHEREAEIIAQAGRSGAVTIATNMAGRGTDIILGGNPEFLAKTFLRKKGIDPKKASKEEWEKALAEAKKITDEDHKRVVEKGGLHVIGTERHEARRIDNQLRGRAGRQGDPGSSRFYLSLEDDLMRIFGSDRIKNLMAKIGMQEGVPIEHKMVTKAIERAQKQVEAQNFSIRKHLLEYDDVMNKQRETIYRMRREILEGKNLKEQIQQLIEELVDWILDIHADPRKDPEEWDKEGLRKALITQFIFDINELNIDWENIEHGELRDLILSHLKKIYMEKEEIIGSDQMREFERLIMLQVIDSQWKDHLLAMDYLKEGIGLRGYGQRDPLVEYKKESFEMFQSMLNRIEEETIRYLFMLQPVVEEERVVREIPHAVYHRPVFNPFSQPSPQAEAVSSVPSSGSTRLREVRAVIPSKKRRRK